MIKKIPALFLIAILSAPSAFAVPLKGRVTSVNHENRTFQIVTTNRETQRIDVLIVSFAGADMEGVDVDTLSIGQKVTVDAEEKEGIWNASSVSAIPPRGGTFDAAESALPLV